MEDQYAAGLFDGEGTVTLSHIQRGGHRYPVASVSSTTIELLEFLKRGYGGSISHHKTYQQHHKKSYSWKVSANAALKFFAKVVPYSKEPEKVRRMHLILTEYKSVTQRNGRYNSEQLQAKQNFEHRFFHPSTP